MKKFMAFLAAMLLVVGVNAQTIEDPKFFENTQVTLMGGGIYIQQDGVRPIAGIEVAKYVTPVVGFGIEGLAQRDGTGTQTNVVGNLKFNLSNLIGKYPGEPRRVEVVLNPGLGWAHEYGQVYRERNYFTYNAGAEININLGQKKAWAISVRPAAVWTNYNRVRRFHAENLQGRLMVGITYKFGSKSKNSHNFVVCPYSITQAQYEALKKDYERLAAKEPEVKIVENTLIKEILKLEAQEVAPVSLEFEIGSAELKPTEKEKLVNFVKSLPEGVKFKITGSADSGTGTEKINKKLSAERAEAVVGVLKELGITNIENTATFDIYGDKPESRAAVIESR